MTETEWLSCSDPQAMLTFLRARPHSDRKHRLFACACCRRIWDRFPDPRNRAVVAAVEDYPDRTFCDPEIHDPAVASSACERECAAEPAYWVAKSLGRGFYKTTAAVSAALVASKALFLEDRERGREVECALALLRLVEGASADPVRLPAPLPRAAEAEAAAQAALLRDVFGNPFRPAPFDATWRTDTVLLLARQMDEAREFDAMPILADALQDAGCDNTDVLDHCRGEGPHVRGCWVIDRLLGKE